MKKTLDYVFRTISIGHDITSQIKNQTLQLEKSNENIVSNITL
jgi:hypothetical protein